MRSNIARRTLCAAITVTTLCAALAQAQASPDEDRLAVEVAGADGLLLEFDWAQAWFDGDGVHLGGELAFEFAGTRTTLFDAEVRVTVDEDGRIDTFTGRARVAPDPVAALEMADFEDLIVGELGLAYGRDLAHLGAPLQDDARYLFVHVEVGPTLGLGAFDAGVRGGATMVLDPTDPYFFVEGHIDGLNELTIVESGAIGVSAHGRIPLSAAHDWGLDGITTEMTGHLYVAGRALIPKTPLVIDGELLIDADVNDDGRTLFHGSPEAGLLMNGSLEVDLELGPLMGVVLPVASASAGGFIIGDQAAVWYSGEVGVDLRDVVPELPFEMHGRVMAAGYASTTVRDSFVVFGGDVQLGDWSLFDGTLYVDVNGADLEATMDLQLMRVDVRGRVGHGGMALSGMASFDHALRVPREVTEWVDVAVQYTANAAVCGYETVSDGMVCGWDYAIDGAVCGYNVVTDGVQCGWDTVWGWFCGWSGLCSRREARTCDVARGCHFEASCEVPGSCERIEQRRETRIVPDIDFGRISGELLIEVVNGDVRAAARTGYCDVAGNCMSIESGLRVSPHDIQLCLPVPELGQHCMRL